MTDDRILRGIVLMLVFCLLAPLLDVSAKLAAQGGIPVGQITTARFVVQGALMLPVVLFMGLSLRLPRRALGFVILRAIFLILSTFSFVSGIAVMPVADALAIAFVEPFIVLILGSLIFGDHVGPRRIAASAVGFGGALLVIQPSLAVFGWVALWPLGTAFFFAFYMLVTRAISAYMHPVTMQFHTSWTGLLICLPVMLAAEGTGWAEFDPVWPQGLLWLWLFGVGFWAAVSHMCMTYALKYAPSATLAPLHYSEIVVAVALGFAVFGDFPNAMTWAGIAVIVSSGLYIIHRERLAARVRPLPSAP
ncbi:MAG: DMT family transporter [Tabrizicola sp.]|uniref:DMT family transporter n=1 Tax=Tabrizicola sp. TaxID=2005166 RepID=UPI0027344568|nr:DMT family transporter [Tabrizicola sp.]MDP3263757.1 DMT family transporter [Tabrizicola sp.]MDP3647121.1 DMT family transporter [Paracoccaceae bacterium]MDZ4068003.1 DMT family transporter [Tabrizicola sp.]